jgi:hypothetical protein
MKLLISYLTHPFIVYNYMHLYRYVTSIFNTFHKQCKQLQGSVTGKSYMKFVHCEKQMLNYFTTIPFRLCLQPITECR